MVGEPEGEATVRIRLRLMPLVEGDRRLTGFAQSTDDAQFTTCDHGLIDDDIGHGRSAADHDDRPG